MNSKYEEYYTKWLSGLESEIEFWKLFMEEKGGISFHGYEETISANREFELEDDIPLEYHGKEYKFLDVGAGPFSRCGRITERVRLDALSVDPLAGAYNVLKDKNHIDNGVRLETGFVELLSKKFEENTFDMVHMSNALDHSFDAVFGIFQMLYVCKIGGRVILRHAENEAKKARYGGLHQWNLSLHNAENTFLIWRNDVKYNIPELFKDYADIALYPDCVERGGGWLYNKVVMVKKKNIVLPDVDYYDEMLRHTYDYLLTCLLKNVEKRERKPMTKNEIACQKIIAAYYAPENLLRKLQVEKIESVDIYGMGEVGTALYHLLEKCGVQIDQVMDRKKREFRGKKTISLEEYIPHTTISRVIVTINEGKEEVMNLLSAKLDKNSIVDVDGFLEECGG